MWLVLKNSHSTPRDIYKMTEFRFRHSLLGTFPLLFIALMENKSIWQWVYESRTATVARIAVPNAQCIVPLVGTSECGSIEVLLLFDAWVAFVTSRFSIQRFVVTRLELLVAYPSLNWYKMVSYSVFWFDLVRGPTSDTDKDATVLYSRNGRPLAKKWEWYSVFTRSQLFSLVRAIFPSVSGIKKPWRKFLSCESRIRLLWQSISYSFIAVGSNRQTCPTLRRHFGLRSAFSTHWYLFRQIRLIVAVGSRKRRAAGIVADGNPEW